jgi:hypothetical protein
MAWWETGEGFNDSSGVGPNARRRYVEGYTHGGTVATLPAKGAAFPGNSNLKRTKIDYRRLDNGPDREAIVHYAPDDPSNAAPGTTAYDDLKRTGRIGGEILMVDANGGWTWTTSNEEAAQQVPIRIGSGTLTIEETVSSLLISSSQGAWQKSLRNVGSVNNAAFHGLGVNAWLYIGANWDRTFTSSGATMYRVGHTFQYRHILDGDPPVAIANPWQKLWDEDAGIWDSVIDKNNRPLYKERPFADIFSTSNVV